MGQTLLQTKNRIASISSTYKVTSAMKLVSTVKLKSISSKMEHYKYFANAIEGVFSSLDGNKDEITSPYFKKFENGKRLFIIISSSLGLCGSYNNNVFELAEKEITHDDVLLLIGQKAKTHFKEYNTITLDNLDNLSNDDVIKEINKFVMDEYPKGTYKEINIIYTHFKNSITFIPEKLQLLPINPLKNDKNTNPNKVKKECLIEPNKEQIIDELVTLYVSSLIRGRLTEAFTSEHASRRNAMENASDNAKEMIDDLKLEYNKARQGQITNEIIDIVGASIATKGE